MRILKVNRKKMLNFAVKHNLESAIKDLNYLGSVIDGGTVEDFMSKAKFLSEYVQTHWNPSQDEVVFANKQDVLALFDQKAMNRMAVINEIRYNPNPALDLPISVLGEYEKYFSSEYYSLLRDIRYEDYMEFFYESICEPIMNAIESANIEIGDWTYIATIDFVLENITPDQEEVNACQNFLAELSMAC